MPELNTRQQRFVEEYQVDFNATQACIRAGYSQKTARQMGTENLSKPAIQNALQQSISKRSERMELNADWVVEQLRQTYQNASSEGVHSAALKALELLGKHLGMFQGKIESNAPGIESIIHEIWDEQEQEQLFPKSS